MFEIVKSVLNSGGYNLTNTIKKINSLWVQGKLTDEEYNELVTLARTNANVQEDVDLLSKVIELEKRVVALENNITSNAPTPEETVEDFVEGKWYYNGDKCNWKGKTYTCIAPDGVVCVWSPEAYPTYWETV